MSDQFWIAFFACIPATIAALGALFVSINNQMKLRKIHIDVNGRLTQLLSLTATASRAEGILQEKERTSV